MEFGLHLPASTAGVKSEDLIRFAQQAETLGFYCITVADHVIVPRDISVPYPYTTDGKYPGTGYHLETLMTMGFLAGATNRIRFVTSVMILPYRNPIVTAKMLASLDVLSGGRVIVGAGRRLDEGRIRNLAHRAVRGARQSHRRIHRGVQRVVDKRQSELQRQVLQLFQHRLSSQARAEAGDPDLDRRPQQTSDPPRRAPRRRLASHRRRADDSVGARGRRRRYVDVTRICAKKPGAIQKQSASP